MLEGGSFDGGSFDDGSLDGVSVKDESRRDPRATAADFLSGDISSNYLPNAPTVTHHHPWLAQDQGGVQTDQCEVETDQCGGVQTDQCPDCPDPQQTDQCED